MINLLRPPKFIATAEPPSITAQGLDCHIVSFGKAKTDGVEFFNTGLVHAWGRDWLITRKCTNSSTVRIGINSIMAFGLTNLVPQIGYNLVPQMIAPPLEHVEDPRAVFHDNHVWIGCCNFVWDDKVTPQMYTGAHQVLFRFDQKWQCVQRFDPVYGNNLDRISARKGHEKNWLWFFHQGELHMVYRTHPHVVAVFDKEVKFKRDTASEWDNSGWRYGEMRGGTPPVLADNLYWSFYHSSIDKAAGDKRRYYMGAYCFEAKPPFKVVGYTEKPLLIASKQDRWGLGKPACIFGCGAIYRDSTWIISGGVNDLDTFIAKIPQQQLLERTTML